VRILRNFFHLWEIDPFSIGLLEIIRRFLLKTCGVRSNARIPAGTGRLIPKLQDYFQRSLTAGMGPGDAALGLACM
jgi:hypothetical protein